MRKAHFKEIRTILIMWLIILVIFILACTLNPVYGQAGLGMDTPNGEIYTSGADYLRELDYIEYMIDSCECTVKSIPRDAKDFRNKIEWIERTFPYDNENDYYLYYDIVIKIKGKSILYMRNPSAEL